METTAATQEERHPSPRAYVKIAVVLGLITAMEVIVYYLPAVTAKRGLFIGLLLFFSMIKFFLVAMNFMHLKFDSRIFRRLFLTGIVLALGVFSAVLATFGLFK
jgi:cytochrome c oxidase subunit IV